MEHGGGKNNALNVEQGMRNQYRTVEGGDLKLERG
jgi:hypothetical protein